MYKILSMLSILLLFTQLIYAMEKETPKQPQIIQDSRKSRKGKPTQLSHSAPTNRTDNETSDKHRKPTRSLSPSPSVSPEVAKRIIEEPTLEKKQSPTIQKITGKDQKRRSYLLLPQSFAKESPRTVDSSPKSSPRKIGIMTNDTKFPTVLNSETLPILTAALRKKDKKIELIMHCLSNPESLLNCQDIRGNSFLHHIVLQHDSLLFTLLKNQKIYTLTQNADGKAAYEYLSELDMEYKDWYQALLERAILDHIVDALIISHPTFMNPECSDETIITAIGLLLERISQPILPFYSKCNPDFIFGMVRSRLKDLSLLQITHDEYLTNPKYEKERIQHAIYLCNQDFLNKPANNPNLHHLLHNAIVEGVEHHKPQLTLLLRSPYINTLIKKDGKSPFQYITHDAVRNNPSLYATFQQRKTLDHIITALLILNPELVKKKCSNKTIDEAIDNLLKRISLKIIPPYAHRQFIAHTIHTRRIYDRLTLQKLHKAYKNNPNYKNENGDTLLHQTVYVRDENMIKKLVKDPRVRSLKNDDKFAPQGLLYSLENEEIRALLFLRNTLESIACEIIENDATPILMTDPKIDPATLTKDDIHDAAQKLTDIQKKFEEMKKKQEGKSPDDDDRALPASTTAPDYLIEDFLVTALQAFISEKQSTETIFSENSTDFVQTYDITGVIPTSESTEDPSVETTASIDTLASAIEARIMNEKKVVPIISVVDLDEKIDLIQFLSHPESKD